MSDFDAGFAETLGAFAPQRANQGLIIEFTLEPIENEEKTKKAGRLICDDVEYVSIRIPGEIDIQRHPVTDIDRERFPQAYAAYKASQPQEAVSGTPLSKWPGSPSLSRVREAAALGIHTVEQLAVVSDANIGRLGVGWIAIRQKARDYLAAAKDSAVLFELRAENEALKVRLSSLEQVLQTQAKDIDKARQSGGTLPAATGPDPRMAHLEEMVATLAARLSAPPPQPAPSPAPKKKRGRPSKAEIAAREAAEQGQG